MEIYVVQLGDTIFSIARRFGITVERLISDNGLINADSLVPGQALIILYPQKTYIVRSGDTLDSIAKQNEVTVIQLLRNNPFLHDRTYLYSGETLVISYRSEADLEINGYSFVFTNLDILRRSLPYLTYISVFNYRIVEDANVISYGDDTDIIKIAKEYQTIPLLMISAFSPTGELDIDSVYKLLLDEKDQVKIVTQMVQIVKSKGYNGINALISNINETNQNLYLNVLTKLSDALKLDGYLFILTINPQAKQANNIDDYLKLDYDRLNQIVDRIIFLRNIWGTNNQPPAPVSNISLIDLFINNLSKKIALDNISIGIPLIGYDWDLPFIPGTSYATSLSLNSTITLAYDQQAFIQSDETSQTPYFNYVKSYVGYPQSHIVWFIDARTIHALNDIILKYNLSGSGIWSLSSYHQQLWSMINARFTIIKRPVS